MQSHLAVGVLPEVGVEDGVRYLVAHLVCREEEESSLVLVYALVIQNTVKFGIELGSLDMLITCAKATQKSMDHKF